MPKKIVYCTPSLYIAGGVERVLTTKVNWLVEHTDWDVTIILTDGKDKEPYYPLSPRVKVINLDIDFEEMWGMSFLKKCMTYLKKQHTYRRRLADTLMELRPDITVSLLRREINFICEIKDGSRKWGEIHINRTHYRNFEAGNSNFIKNLFSKIWMKNLVSKLQRLDRFIVLTEEDKKCWSELDNVIVIPNPLPFWSEEHSSLCNKRIVAVGRYCHEKGYFDLLDAFSLVHGKHPDWELYIFGTGDAEPYKQKAQELGLANSCHLHGATKDIISEYCKSSIYVLSSKFEGFGMVLIEAMNCGVPVVSYACPTGPLQIIQNGKNGLLAKNGIPADLADKICRIIEDKELMIHLQEGGLSTAFEYSTDNVMARWTRLLSGHLPSTS